MQARYPDRHGVVDSHGTQIYWEVYGDGERTVLFMPTWQIYHSRVWKMQIPYFARHFRVITFDPPGNGRSGRPASGFDHDRCAEDAVARELCALHPDLEIHWLAQDPVTRVLEARGETVHPASRLLAGESAHIESEAGEHDLHVFQAWRSMDEILLANFMVLHDVLEAEPCDLVDRDFGPGLPNIRDWTARHFAFPGYLLPFEPAEFADREGLRARLGYRPDERVVLATVGGSGVGHHLLRRVVAAAPHVRRLVPDCRLIAVTGPRIDPTALPRVAGVEYRRFLPDLYAHLAACDLAVVQGGLSTCMELTATKRPFIYFPLRNHFEQNIHVPHRLARDGAGVRTDYHQTDPEGIALAITDGLKRPVVHRDVETDGARRAARIIAGLL